MRLATAAGLGAAAWTAGHVRAPTVRRWHGSSAPVVTAGPLRTRVVADAGPARSAGAPTLVLLHGIVGCGAYFGAPFDVLARGRRLVVPDLLGFGDSYLAAAPSGYGLEPHLDALDAMAAALRLDGPLVVAGHSMGAVLALHWAARRSDLVARVVALSAPLYDSTTEALAHIRGLGRLEALMALDGPVARATCAWMCHHRTTAGWVAAAIKPQLPIPLARRGALHTWPAYLGSMDGLILNNPWRAAVKVLADREIPTVLAAGGRDPVPVAGRAAELAAPCPTVTVRTHPTAGHDLPLADPDWCRDLLAESSATSPPGAVRRS